MLTATKSSRPPVNKPLIVVIDHDPLLKEAYFDGDTVHICHFRNVGDEWQVDSRVDAVGIDELSHWHEIPHIFEQCWREPSEHEPECEPNTLGDFLQVILANGSHCFAFYAHDWEPESNVDSKYFSGIDLAYEDGILTVENEFYQVFPVVRYRVLQ